MIFHLLHITDSEKMSLNKILMQNSHFSKSEKHRPSPITVLRNVAYNNVLNTGFHALRIIDAR